MNELNPLAAPDPYAYRAIWGIPPRDRRGFDLLVARQLLWLPYAKPTVRRMLFTEDEQPICPACGQLVTTGTPSVICVALLADRELQEQLERDPMTIVMKNPDSQEAWWLLHGTCVDELSRARVRELDQRIELALRADTRAN
jgi:hypothetical protein